MRLLKLLFILIVALGLFRLPVYAAIVINEILPKSEDIPNEWIELYNTGSETVDLNRWTVSNTEGGINTFIIPASGIISPHGFLLFHQSQMGINFNKDGDTIRLSDDKNTLIDSQSYPSTLGYNTTMGRSPDGGNSWMICTARTPNLPNECPVATPTPTDVPTDTPMPTATTVPVSIDIPPSQDVPVYQPPETNSVLSASVVNTPTPMPHPDDLVTVKIPSAITVSKTIILQGIIVIGAWILLVLIALARRKRRIRKQ